MAAHFDGVADSLTLAAAARSGSWSFCALVQMTNHRSDNGAYGPLFDDGSFFYLGQGTEIDGDAHAFFQSAESTVGVFPFFATWMVPGSEWYFVASSYNSTTGVAAAYFGTGETGSSVEALSKTWGTGKTGTAPLYIGNNSFGQFWDGAIKEVRIWNTALTQAEFVAEWGSSTSIVKTGAWAYYPLGANGNDTSGNARNLTANGTVTFDGAGGTSATATPAVIARAVTVPAVSASGAAVGTATPAVIARAATLPAAAAHAGAGVSPAVIARAVGIDLAGSVAGTIGPDTIASAVTMPAVVGAAAGAGKLRLGSAVVTGLKLGAATVSKAYMGTAQVWPAAPAVAPGTAAPAVIARAVTVPAAAASGAAAGTAAPAVIARAAAVPAATTSGGAGATTSPLVIARAATVPAAAATSSATGTATPTVIARAAAVPAATPQASKTTAPAVISRAATMPAATATGGGAALAVVYSDSGGGSYVTGVNGPSLTLPSWSVTAGEFLVVALGGCGAGAGLSTSQWSLSGGGLTWTKRVEGFQTAAFRASAAFFTATATSTTALTNLVANHVDGLQVMYARWRATGVNATPIGATAVLADDSTDGVKDITLNATPASSSIVLAVAYENATEGTTKKTDHGASDGWTEDFDFGPSMNGTNMWGCWEGQRKTSPTLTRVRWDNIQPASMTDETFSFCGVAIEIRA